MFLFFAENRLVFNRDSEKFSESPFWRNVRQEHDACGIGFVVTKNATREAVTMALDGLCGMRERSGSAFDAGDGAGIIMETAGARKFYEQFLPKDRHVEQDTDLAVGMFFLDRQLDGGGKEMRKRIKRMLFEHGIVVHGWRDVPTTYDVLPAHIRGKQPECWQLLYSRGDGMGKQKFREALFRVQQRIERELKGVYPASLQPDTIVYKARATPDQLIRVYGGDFCHPDFVSSQVGFHGRMSTNTEPDPENAQPFGLIWHNGEINTDRALSGAQRDLEVRLGLTLEGEECVTVDPKRSDSSHFNGMLKSLISTSDISGPVAMRRRGTPARSDLYRYDEETRKHFELIERTQGAMAAKQGPEAICGMTASRVWVTMDPLSLRTFWIYGDDDVTVGSSLPGSPPIPLDKLKFVHRLKGGNIASVRKGKLVLPDEMEKIITRDDRLVMVGDSRLIDISRRAELPDENVELLSKSDVIKLWNQVGGDQHVAEVLDNMALNGKEPIYGMGDDRPLAVMSPGRLRMAAHFSQVVAVVTNPPIDPLREGADFVLKTFLGCSPKQTDINDPNTYQASPELVCSSPILNLPKMKAIRENGEVAYREIDTTFEGTTGADMEKRLKEIIQQCVALAEAGNYPILIFSDRRAREEGRLFIPQVLIGSVLDDLLKKKGLRAKVKIVSETMDALEAHDTALLISQGFDAACPYVIWETVMNGDVIKWQEADVDKRLKNVEKSMEMSLKKIMAKMGIFAVDGYRGGCFFEALGIDGKVSKKYLPNNVSQIGGMDFDDMVEDQLARLQEGRKSLRKIKEPTSRKGRVFGFLNAFLLNPKKSELKDIYREMCEYIEERDPVFLRDLLAFVPAVERGGESLPLNKVESVASIICRHFRGSQMSDGAVGPTAHRAFAEAINSMAEKFMALLELEGSDSPGYSERLNKRPTSGSGEGGEHRSRYPGGAMEKACSKAKQIASGRFGADAWYIVSIGDDGELQIKIGQGAKPGQGGQIDGGKIDERLARQRGTLAGVTLVSPPPQHDIYSIEDLKRLIGDLREAYPEVKTISVKVTTKAGIGTIVSGIAKAGAQKATLSGNSGGTGAAESSAIRYTGSPGELGLFETLHTLKKQGMFNKIIIECDGGLITGRDIVAMAVHGSDEFGFGSSLEQAAAACIFCRDCAINTCPVGLNTTLIENLARLGFGGKAEAMLEKMESMTFEEQAKNIGEALELYWVTLAEDVRGILAMIGVESLEACRGRFDVVKRLYGADRERLKISRIADEDERAKAEANLESRLDAGEKYPEDRVNLDFLWKEPDYEVPDFGDEPIVRPNPVNAVNQMMVEAAKSFDGDRLVMEIPLIGSAEYKGENYDGGMRAIGSTLACEIARGNVKVPLGGFHFKFKGYPGQSFGFLNVEGVTLELTGIANDFVGSGMSGGKIIIKPPAHLQSEEPIDLAGATCAYGARKHSDDQMTGGKLFVAGKIGQRFGVRCCLDAVIICEGCDNFGFEYTTGGVGVVLGEVGSGFASGMSAGEVFVLNENGTLVDRLNKEDARIVPMNDVDKVKLHALLTEYYADTASPKAARILQNWEAESLKFARVISTYEPKPQQISDLARKRLADMARDGGVLPVIADMIV